MKTKTRRPDPNAPGKFEFLCNSCHSYQPSRAFAPSSLEMKRYKCRDCARKHRLLTSSSMRDRRRQILSKSTKIDAVLSKPGPGGDDNLLNQKSEDPELVRKATAKKMISQLRSKLHTNLTRHYNLRFQLLISPEDVETLCDWWSQQYGTCIDDTNRHDVLNKLQLMTNKQFTLDSEEVSLAILPDTLLLDQKQQPIAQQALDPNSTVTVASAAAREFDAADERARVQQEALGIIEASRSIGNFGVQGNHKHLVEILSSGDRTESITWTNVLSSYIVPYLQAARAGMKDDDVQFDDAWKRLQRYLVRFNRPFGGVGITIPIQIHNIMPIRKCDQRRLAAGGLFIPPLTPNAAAGIIVHRDKIKRAAEAFLHYSISNRSHEMAAASNSTSCKP